MNEKTKKYVSYAAVVALLAVSYSVIQASSAYKRSAEPDSFRSFTVSGEGKVVSVPDVAKFSFSVITKGTSNVPSLQEENTKKVNSAIEYIKSQGVDKKDIITESYTLSPEYETYNCYPTPLSSGEARPCPPPKIVGYTLRQSVTVKARDFEKVGSLLAGVVEKGATEVSELSFTIDDPKQVEAEAREKAIAEAKEKARDIAKAGGFSVGKLLSINEGGSYPPIYYSKTMAVAEDAAYGMGGAAPRIEPGSQDVVINVALQYEIR